MTQKDKQLLRVDLSARLPYGVKVYVANTPREIIDYGTKGYITILTPKLYEQIGLREIKPYLRPMSSMTEEEWEELNSIGYIVPLYDGSFGVDMRAYCKYGQPHYRRFSEFSTIEDWLNAHHLDYRGLIEPGLAIEVTKIFSPYVYPNILKPV